MKATIVEADVLETSVGYPAHSAAYAGDLARVRYLIESGIVNVNERDHQGCTPLHKGENSTSLYN